MELCRSLSQCMASIDLCKSLAQDPELPVGIRGTEESQQRGDAGGVTTAGSG